MMEIGIDFTKSAQENANDYYSRSKKLVVKREGAEKAIKELESRLVEIQKNLPTKKERTVIKVVKKEWYEKFHWFFTSNDMLTIGGRDAQQNEQLNSKYFDDKDLFFHANVFGADVVILKGGASTGKETREEVAEFAACYSRAWGEGLHTVDVYAMKREQVSKSSSKGSLGTGSFLLSGERDWYRNVPLSLVMFLKNGKLNTVPSKTFENIPKDVLPIFARIKQGNYKKSDIAKKIAAKLQYNNIDEIMRQLPPAGGFRME